jgi:hypothetical protein
MEVLIENLSEEESRFSMTFILDGLFIVVDGDHSVNDVTILVENLIADRVTQPAATVSVPILPTSIVPTSSSALPENTILATIGGMGLTMCGLGICLAAGMLPLIAFFIKRNSTNPPQTE